MQTVTPGPAEIWPGIMPKDNVEILLVDGTKIRRMKVGAIDSSSMVGHIAGQPKGRTDTVTIKEISGIQKLAGDRRLYVVSPGNTINVTMKSGETIRNLKVSTVDSVHISGVEYIYGSSGIGGKWQELNRSEIARIKVSVSEPFSTVAGVVLAAGVITGVIFMAQGLAGLTHLSHP